MAIASIFRMPFLEELNMSFKCSKVHFDNLTREVKLSNNSTQMMHVLQSRTLDVYVTITDELVTLELVTLMSL